MATAENKMENAVLIEKFLNSLIVSGCANSTTLAYKTDLKQFQTINNFAPLGVNIDKQFNNFVYNYKPKNGDFLSYRSMCRKIAAIRSFYNYLLEVNYIKDVPNFVVNFKTPTIKKQSPKILSKEEIETLINSCKKNSYKSEKKKLSWIMMAAIIECLYSSGMRISECLSLKINQIFDNQANILNEVQIIGKGNKSRMIFLNQQAQKSLIAFLQERFDQESLSVIKNYTSYLFSIGNYTQQNNYTKQNTLFKKYHFPISRIKVYVVLKKLAILNNIHPSKVSPHVFRHSIAVHLLLSKNNNQQNNIALIKSFLGHSTIDTTKIYLGYEDSDNLRNILLTKHPLSKK